MPIIYAFGDSITYGAWDTEGSGWANRIRLDLDKRSVAEPDFYALFFNLGISGETTDGLVKRFDSEYQAREREDEEAIFIFAYGANDAVVIPSTGKFRTTTEDFKTNLESVIKKAKDISKKIIILNITPVIEEVTFKSETKDKSRLNKYVESYNHIIKSLADEYTLAHVDVYDAYTKSSPKDLLSEDGLHPNAKGHELMYEMVSKELRNLL